MNDPRTGTRSPDRQAADPAAHPERPGKVVVVGGVAGGMSFAARARRLAEDARIVVLERGPHVSFANCGLPYHLGGEIADRQDLLLNSPQSLEQRLALDVRTGHEVVSIDPDARLVQVRELATGREYTEDYEALVLATGAAPILPDLPGVDLPGVHVLRNVEDVDGLQARLAAGAHRAVVAGAGFVGLEVAEALRERGLQVHLVELTDQVLAVLDPEMATPVERELRAHGVDVHLSTAVTGMRKDADGALAVDLSDGTTLVADLVLFAVGVRPQTELAAAAGLDLGPRGALLVDEHQRTSAPAVYAVGDAVQVVDAVTGAGVLVPLAGPANRQGRAVADHLFGRRSVVAPVLGTAVVRVFGTVAASTGRTEKALRAAGIAHQAVHLHPGDHAGYYPGAQAIHLKVVFAPDGRVLGAQATGAAGVDKRIDVLATAIRAGMGVADLAELELAYAPPFGSAKDPVNMAGFVAENVLAGDLRLWRAADLAADPADGESAVLVDVRSPEEFAGGHLAGALNIPLPQLRARLAQIPADRSVRLNCASGFRSYLAARVLMQSGWTDVRSLSGGLSTLRLEPGAPDLVKETPTTEIYPGGYSVVAGTVH